MLNLPNRVKLLLIFGVVVIAGVMAWNLVIRFNSSLVQTFSGVDRGGPQAVMDRQKDGSWLLNLNDRPVGTLSMKSENAGFYEFRIEQAINSSLAIGTRFSLMRGGFGSDLLLCEKCIRNRSQIGTNLPEQWSLTK